MDSVTQRWKTVGLLLLTMLIWPDHQVTGAAAECELDVDGVQFLQATLARCLQRCRDSVSRCEQVAYRESSQQCIIVLGSEATGIAANETGWTLHSVDSAACGYGRGRSSSSVSCQICQAGAASHAEVGDLAGVWSLTDADSGTDQGYLEVSRGGLATYSTGQNGQFVLFHTRADPNYPGAFFLEHQGLLVAAARGAGWEYAWLEDSIIRILPDGSVVEQPRLTVRRFCGEAPAVCPQQLSPEGSPFFLQTLHGHLASQGDITEADCMLLEGDDTEIAEGPCCRAAADIERVQDDKYTATIAVPSMTWEDVPLVRALWNEQDGATVLYQTLLELQGLPVRTLDGYLDLCPSNRSINTSGLSQVVAVVKRGGCTFAEKVEVAYQAGALAVLVVNDEQSMLEYLSLNPGVQAPRIPAWKIEREVGDQIIAALASGQGTLVKLGRLTFNARMSALRDLCCPAQCRSRLARASAEARQGVPDMAGVCSLVDCLVTPNISSSPDDLPSSSGSCHPCSFGMAATVPGLASCGRCGDGTTPSFGGASCEACPTGRAGTGGRCSKCLSGLMPDDLRHQCVTPATAAPSPTTPPANCPPTTQTGGSNTNNGNNDNSGSTSSTQRFAFATNPPTASDMEGDGNGFPWVTLIIVLCVIILLCICCWYGVKFLQHYAQNAPEGSAIAQVASVMGSKKDDDDESDEEEGAAKGPASSPPPPRAAPDAKAQDEVATKKRDGAAPAAKAKVSGGGDKAASGGGDKAAGNKDADNKSSGNKDGGSKDASNKDGSSKSGGKKEGGNKGSSKTGGGPSSIQFAGVKINFS